MRINGISMAIKVRSKSELALTEEWIYIDASFTMVLVFDGIDTDAMKTSMVTVIVTVSESMIYQVMVFLVRVIHVMW